LYIVLSIILFASMPAHASDLAAEDRAKVDNIAK
jgi:hypothetical protein